MAAPISKSMASKRRKLAEMTVEEFMSGGVDSDEETSSSDSYKKTKISAKETKQKAPSAVKHKKSLEKLKDQDPEFYEFLKNEDQSLLDFQNSDEEYDDSDLDDEGDVADEDEDEEEDDDDVEIDETSDEEDEDSLPQKKKKKKKGPVPDSIDDLDMLGSSDSDEDEETGGKYHKLPQKLEVGSDESEDEEEDVSGDEAPTKKSKKTPGIAVTSKMVKEWDQALQNKPSIPALKEVMCAFKAVVVESGATKEVIKYSVKGSNVFNAVVRTCLANMSPALHQVLGLPPLSDLSKPSVPSDKNKKWKKIRLDVKAYLTDLLKFLGQMNEQSMVDVILKHIHKLVAFFSCFPKLAKVLMKRMIILWSTAEETTRLLSFFCINRLIRIMQKQFLEPCIKQMYMAYVKNCKFTSPSTLPNINFMQRSLVEIFAIDIVLAYQYTFVYIRQLAIHLRNAITVKKKETCQAVYNWQYIHCLELWVRLLSATYPNEALEPLIYPLTQTIIGTIKLMPTAKYFPLRFHCVRALTSLSESTDTFIPVLPFLLEVLEQTNFNKKHGSINIKPFNFACILKLSKSQLQEKSFRDGLIDQLYELFLDQFHVHAHSVGFPELVLPAVLQLKTFLKKCKVANYCKQMKQIVDKVEDTSKFITNRRKTFNVNLADTKAIEAWERKLKEEGTPLIKYYKTWRKLRDRELMHQIAQKDQVVGLDDKLPTVDRLRGPAKATEAEKREFSALFDTDSEDEDDETRFLPKDERPVKKQKTEDSGSEYSDFDSDELEILAGSGNEDEDESDIEVENEEYDEDDDVEEEEEDDNSNINKDNDEDDEDKDDIVEDFEMSDSD